MVLYSKKALEILVSIGFADAEYQMGLEYCMKNDAKSAMYWLKRAAFQGHQKAIDTIHEILEKKLMDE